MSRGTIDSASSCRVAPVFMTRPTTRCSCGHYKRSRDVEGHTRHLPCSLFHDTKPSSGQVKLSSQSEGKMRSN